MGTVTAETVPNDGTVMLRDFQITLTAAIMQSRALTLSGQ